MESEKYSRLELCDQQYVACAQWLIIHVPFQWHNYGMAKSYNAQYATNSHGPHATKHTQMMSRIYSPPTNCNEVQAGCSETVRCWTTKPMIASVNVNEQLVTHSWKHMQSQFLPGSLVCDKCTLGVMFCS